MFSAVNSAHASSDAITVSSLPVTANIPQAGDIWSADVPTAAQFPKSSTYPCGYVVIPVKGILPIATLADKAKGVSIKFGMWSDAGANIGTGYISPSDWNPVGPITLGKVFICGDNLMGTHTLLIETTYYTATNGLLSSYLSTKSQSRITLSIQAAPPVAISDFKLSLNGEQIATSWSTPSSEAAITGYELALFDTNPNSPLPPLGYDLKSPVTLISVPSSQRSATLAWSDVYRASSIPGSSIVFKVRTNSSSGPSDWSNGIYLTKDQAASHKPLTQTPPKPNFTVFLSGPDAFTISLSANDVKTYIDQYKVSSYVTKIRTKSGYEQVGNTSTISSANSYLAQWIKNPAGDYDVSVALINALGQGEWADYSSITVPSYVAPTPTPTPTPTPSESPTPTVKKPSPTPTVKKPSPTPTVKKPSPTPTPKPTLSATPAATKTNPVAVKVTAKANLNREFTFMSEMVSALNQDGPICPDYAKNTTPTIGTREEGTCHFNGQEITLDLFADSKTAPQIINAIKGLAGGYILGLKNWAIFVSDEQTAKLFLNTLKLKLY
jgi:hypothetical protein